MVCLYCGSETVVVNSRAQKRHNTIWRRRECSHCRSIITTRELIDLSKAVLVRTERQKQPQPFSRDKLFMSILEACRHRARSLEEAAALTETVTVQLLQQLVQGFIERNAIIVATRITLEKFDPLAATLYAAYHK